MKNANVEKERVQGGYILVALKKHFLNGDAYVNLDEIYNICKKSFQNVEYSQFQKDLKHLLLEGSLCREGRRVYLKQTLRYEESAALSLAIILKNNAMPCPTLPHTITMKNGVSLCKEQRDAVEMALSCRLSVVLGGAGTGKSTLIQAITQYVPQEGGHVLCAPTGKAARNLSERTGKVVRTVHSALGVLPDEDFLDPVCWDSIGLVVVDEASMMTVGMFAGILKKVRWNCRVVLLGDSNQLLSVGSGNVLPDLLRLGVPCTRLSANHRQDEGAKELLANVTGFSNIHSGVDLLYGDSFQLMCASETCARESLIDEAVCRYLAGERVQVLSPYNAATDLSVAKLNHAIRDRVNPKTEEMKVFGDRFRDGDRVIITRNDRERNCSNGDVGFLNIIDDSKEKPLFQVVLPDGRCPTWSDMGGLEHIALAYALTVHKSQGSEYDTILMPITDSFSNMLYRNLIYTAISRARQRVILYGSRNALSTAVQKPAKERRSQLVQKCGMASTRCA